MKVLAIVIMIVCLPFMCIGFIYEMFISGFRAGKDNYNDLHDCVNSHLNK